jgi:hypothetical protein
MSSWPLRARQGVGAVAAAMAISMLAACSKRSGEPPPRVIAIARSEMPAPTRAFTRRMPVPPGIDPELVGDCNLESVDGRAFGDPPAVVRQGEMLRLEGWAFVRAMDGEASEVHAVLLADGSSSWYVAPASLGAVRTDVAALFHLGVRNRVGFDVAALLDLPPGDYKLLLHLARQGRHFLCDNGRRLRVIQ